LGVGVKDLTRGIRFKRHGARIASKKSDSSLQTQQKCVLAVRRIIRQVLVIKVENELFGLQKKKLFLQPSKTGIVPYLEPK
jgi:hypothetical protein